MTRQRHGWALAALMALAACGGGGGGDAGGGVATPAPAPAPAPSPAPAPAPTPLPSPLAIDAPAEADIGAPITFRAGSDLGAAGLSVSWDFGDGSSSTQAQPVHGYAARGSYTVTLTVRNTAGSTATAQAVVPVWPAITSLDQLRFVDPLRGHALANDGMLVFTTDGGQHWRRGALPAVSGTEVLALQFDDAQNGWLLMVGRDDRQARVQRSTDGGSTWHAAADPPVRLDSGAQWWWPQPNALLITGLAPDASETISVLSTDGGQHWRRAALRVQGLSRGNRPWGVVGGRLLYSTDGGLTAQALMDVPVGSVASAVDLADPADMVVILGTPYFEPAPSEPLNALARQVHHRSTDGGQHWVQTPVTVPSPLNLMFNLQIEGRRGLASIYVNEFFGGDGYGAVRTEDGGLSWRAVEPPRPVFLYSRVATIGDARTVVFNGTADVWFSVDAGEHLQPLVVAGETMSGLLALRSVGNGALLADFGRIDQACKPVSTGSWCEPLLMVERSHLSTDNGITWRRLPGRHAPPATGR